MPADESGFSAQIISASGPSGALAMRKALDGNRIFTHLQWTAGYAAGTLDPIDVQFLLWWRWVS